MRAAVLTVSDGVSRGEREDASGDLLAELLAVDGFEVERRVVPDDRDAITVALSELAEDVTPEATIAVLDRQAPGIAEALRADSSAKTPHGLLSRGTAGTLGATLVVNLPGSTGGCRDGYEVLRPALRHAVELLTEQTTTHSQT